IFPPAFQKVLIRVNSSSDLASSISKISDQWKEVLPNYPFDFQFIDQKFNSLYSSEEQFSAVFSIFTAVAISITCLGLFITVVFDIRKRLKEIGVRRILGGSIGDVMIILSKKFLTMIFVCILICVPLSYIILQQWLLNFAYSVDIEWWVYLVTFLSMLLIFLLTTGLNVIKAARVNPVEVLRDE
ncbi:MAG: FtsX-like permease family protein, partial [Cyclobacteriaceae bacterium]